ncbi:hypothetical protein BH10ACI1_BH10ACI1_23050 [soil metagenome]
MKPKSRSFRVSMILGFTFLFALFFLAPNVRAQNIITGTVFDKQRNRLPDIDVELLDQYYRTIDRFKTDGAGTYSFGGLSNGNFTIRVFAFRYDLEDQEVPIELNSQSARGGVGNGYYYQDIYLIPKKGGLKDAELSVIFAQEIPKEAQTLYEKSLKDLSEKRADEGMRGLMEAIKIFPDYYLALYRFGVELFIRGQYKDSVPVFLKATQVNSKSATSYYYLGSALHKLGKEYDKAALASLNKAIFLAPASPQILLILGKVERALGNIVDAEKHLLQAKKLSTGKVPDIHLELAQLYSNDLKKYNEAADELELYVKDSKLKDEDEKKMKKLISDLREKAKKQ